MPRTRAERPARGELWGVTPENPAGRMQTLWGRVLGQAVVDAFTTAIWCECKRITPEVREQSLNWLFSPECAEVCTLAGYNPDWAMPRLADLVRRYRAGEVLLEPCGHGYLVDGIKVSTTREQRRKAA